MSAVKRVLSGSIASGCGIGVAIISQFVLVPVYLSYWDARTYGAWLALQSAFALIQVIDNGHNRFLWNEFLRFTARRRSLIRRTFWSGACGGLVLGGLQFAVVSMLVFSDSIHWMFGIDSGVDQMADQFASVLLGYSIMWWVFGSIGGIAIYALCSFGHFAKTTWWGVAVAAVTAILPAIAVVLGGNLKHVGFVYVLSIVLCNLPVYYGISCLFCSEQLFPVRPSWKIMIRNLALSQVVTLKTLLELFRQQGIRLILSTLAGVAGVAGFSTTRTLANVAIQGLQTVGSPVQPELMKYLGNREQGKAESSLSVVWLVVMIGMLPGTLVLQVLARPFFEWWTNHRIVFEPPLFAVLSATVLIFGAAQPATSIVVGHNRLRAQLWISFASALATSIGMVALVPRFGLLGAGLSLLVAESVSACGYVLSAKRLLGSLDLVWPVNSFRWVLSGTLFGVIALAAMALAESLQGLLLMISLPTCLGFAYFYWLSIPLIAKQHVWQVVHPFAHYIKISLHQAK